MRIILDVEKEYLKGALNAAIFVGEGSSRGQSPHIIETGVGSFIVIENKKSISVRTLDKRT